MRWPTARRSARPAAPWSPFVAGTRGALVVRGGVAVLVGAVVYAFCFAWGSQVFVSSPQVSVTLPASAGALNVDSSVQYHGVNVGKVAAIDAGTQSSTVRLDMPADGLGRIPADVQVRLVPRTIFGDFYVDLVTPPDRSAAHAAPSLRPGGTLRADQSKATVQLYQAFSRIYDLISAINPAALNTALTTVATALRGQGAALGQAIDTLDRTLARSQPVFDHLGSDLDGIATLSGELNAVAPDLLASLNNAITTSRTILDKQRGITAILTAGAQASGQAAQLLGDNKNRIITLVGDTDPLLRALNAKPDQLTTIYQGLQQLVNKLPAAVATGPWLNADVRLSLQGLAPYQPAQCPRYGQLPGPGCPRSASPATGPVLSGSTGPVGSPAEKAQMAAMFGQNADLDSVLAGPILRGTTVRS